MTTSQSTILHMLGARAAKHPTAAALLAPGRSPLTYRGLDRHVQDTAKHLNALGLGANNRVAIVLPNGPEMATAFLAVASCAVSAPLNPAYRAEEFEFYLSDLQAKALIVQQDRESPARAVAQALGVTLIELTPQSEDSAGLFALQSPAVPAAAPSSPVGVDDIALILHTSGTTSRPKMVPLTHRNLLASAGNVACSLQLTANDRCLNVMPLFHIHGLVAALLASLSAGSSVVCTPGFASGSFFDWLEAFDPTWYTAVPTMHQAILAQAPQHQPKVTKSRLRFVRSSSASLPPQVMAELERTFDAPVIEAYGMTEAAHQMASNPLPPLTRRPGSVGLAAGPQLAIMHPDSPDLLSEDERGEIVIRGDNVTSGYVNNPGANTTAFASGWFRTGDQGYLDGDGYLTITGRLKEIINRGGEKVSPREVDEALLDHPSVAQAVAFAVPHPTLGEDVAAAVVLRPGAVITTEELRAYAFIRLADFKVPSQIVVVDDIPKGPTGKLQRIGLAALLHDVMSPAFVAPRTLTEEVVARVWSETLDGAPVGVNDNFFALGGDSLKATRVIGRLASMLEIELPLASIFHNPTIAETAAVIEDLLLQQLANQDPEDFAEEQR